MDTPEYNTIKEYAQALQRQCQTKQLQHVALYRHLNALEQQLGEMEKYYLRSNQMQRELQQMHQQLNQKDLKLASFHAMQRSFEQKSQLIRKLEHLVAQKEQTIQKLQQQLQMMDDRQFKMRQTLQYQKELTSKLQEQKLQLLEALKQLQTKLDCLNSRQSKQGQNSVRWCEQEITSFLQKYVTIENQLLLQKERCFALQNQTVEFGFLLQTKQNQLQARDIKIRQLESKLLYGEMKKTLSVSSKSSAQLSVSEAFTEPVIKLHFEHQAKFNNRTERISTMKQNNSMIENEIKTQCNQKSSNLITENRWKRKGPSRLQLRNKLLKIQNKTLLQQLQI